MATQAIWVHGNVARVRWPGGKGDPAWGTHTDNHAMNGVFDPDLGAMVEWTDVVGYPTEAGMTFNGRRDNTQMFMAPVPTPCWRSDTGRASLGMVGFTFVSNDAVTITKAQVFDGHQHLLDLPIEAISGPHQTLVENVNRFDLAQPPQVNFGICVCFTVSFHAPSDNANTITFNAIGCDFNV
jgi:hypothetical protein